MSRASGRSVGWASLEFLARCAARQAAVEANETDQWARITSSWPRWIVQRLGHPGRACYPNDCSADEVILPTPSAPALPTLDGPLGPAAAGSVALVVYAATLTTALAGGDAGELITAAAGLEVAHPPGYPLYTLLGHIACWLPTTPATAMSWLSAICEAGAVAGVFVLARSLTRSSLIAWWTALAFAFAPIVWEWAIAPEVFALHHLLLVALLITVDRAARSPSISAAALAGVVGGLSMAHHHTAALLIVPALVVLFRVRLPSSLSRGRFAAAALVGGVLGLLPYLALVPMGTHGTTLSLGDPSTLDGIVRHVLRMDYGTFRLADDAAAAGAGSLAARLALLGAHASEALVVVGWVAFVVALARAIFGKATDARDVGALRFLVGALFLYALVFNSLANLPTEPPLFAGVLARFSGQAILLVVLVAAAGLARLVKGRPVPVAARAMLLLLPLLLVLRADRVTQMHGDEVERLAHVLLDPLPPGAVLLTRGDLPNNAVRYLQHGLGVRGDVLHLDQELLTRDWYVRRATRTHSLVLPGVRYGHGSDEFLLADLLERLDDRPVFIYPEVKPGDTSLASTGHTLVPMGLVARVSKTVTADDLDLARREATAVEALPAPTGLPASSWRRVVADDAVAALHRTGTFLVTQALARGRDPRLLRDAQDVFERAIARLDGPPPWWLAKNLGLVHAQRADADRAARKQTLQLWRIYLSSAPEDEKDRAAIQAAVERYAEQESSDELD